MCESTEREQHKRRAFGENVVLICCYSSTCDVTEKKRYAKNIIHSFEREQHSVLCVFILELFLPKRRSVLVSFVPLIRKHFVREREDEKRVSSIWLLFQTLFVPTVKTTLFPDEYTKLTIHTLTFNRARVPFL